MSIKVYYTYYYGFVMGLCNYNYQQYGSQSSISVSTQHPTEDAEGWRVPGGAKWRCIERSGAGLWWRRAKPIQDGGLGGGTVIRNIVYVSYQCSSCPNLNKHGLNNKQNKP